MNDNITDEVIDTVERIEILENKTTGEHTHGRIGYSWNDNLQWKDDQYNYKMEIEYKPVRFD